MACKYIYNNVTYKSKEEFIEKVVLQEFPTLAGGRYAGVEDGMEFERINGLPSDLKGNQFLSLLAKDNNWVTFFIKSIISDSAKKGYEKVLFPTGNTASKVEGHSTLEEFKKQKEDRLKSLNKLVNEKTIEDWDIDTQSIKPKKLTEESREYKAALVEIKALEQELERVEREGFGALKPIFNFYENNVANILKKQGYTPSLITDEYGNTWNEVNINLKRDLDVITYLRDQEINIIPVDKEETNRTRANEIVNKLLNQLSAQTGIKYNVITQDQAREITKDSKNPWSGEKAFYAGDTVYFVGDQLNINMVLHEYGHPIVRAINFYNNKLFNTLFDQLASTEEGKSIIEFVKSKYPELDSEPDLFKEEVIVRSLEQALKNKVDKSQETTGFIKFINELLFNIKQFLRKAFGQKINISKLDTATTLNELAEMLASGNLFNINTNIVSDEDVVAYMKDQKNFIKDFNKIDKPDLVHLATRVYGVAAKHIDLILHNKNYEQLIGILEDQFKRSDLQEIKSNLNPYIATITKKGEDLRDELIDTQNRIEALVNSMFRIENMAAKINLHLNDLAQNINDPSNLRKAFYYSRLINHWKDLIAETKSISSKKEYQLSAASDLIKLLGSIDNSLDRCSKTIQDIYFAGTKDALVSTLTPIGENIKDRFQSIVSTLKKKNAPQYMIDNYFEEYYGMNEKEFNEFNRLDSLNKSGKLPYSEKNTYEVLKNKSYQGHQITEDKIEKLLKGEIKDAHQLNSFFEGYLYNDDPIVGGFALYVKKQLDEVIVRGQSKYNDFATRFSDLADKLGYNKFNIGELGKKTGFVDIVGGLDDDGKFVKKQVWRFLNPFKDYNYVIDEMTYNIDQAQNKYLHTNSDEDREEIYRLIKLKKTHLRKYFQQEYVDAYYDRFDLLEQDEIGQEASRRREEIFRKMRNLNEQATTELDFMHLTENMDALWQEYRIMHSLYTLEGELKTGNELAIAQRLNEFKEKTREFIEYVERPGAFLNALQKIEQELSNLGFVKGTDDYNIRRQQWLDNNLRTVIKDEFYSRRSDIFQRIKELTSKLPDAAKKDLDFSESWKVILDAVSGFRDNDGQPNGSIISKGRAKIVKEKQEQLLKSMDNWMTASGLTREEMAELSSLFELNKTTDLDFEERYRFNELIGKKNKYGLSKAAKVELNSLFEELKELQSKIATDYYVDIVNNWLLKLDTTYMKRNTGFDNIDKNTANQLLDDNIAQNLMRQNKEFAKWFTDNHIQKEKYNPETGDNELVWERLYIWNVIRPNDPKYLEKTKVKDDLGNTVETLIGLPSLKYYNRKVKREFKTGYDPATGTVKLIVGKHIDNQGEFLPKDFYGSPYRNQAYYDLKESNNQDDKNLFNMLEMLTKEHLKNQEELPYKSRLYLDYPRYRKSSLEALQTGKTLKDAKENWNAITILAKRLRNFFIKTKDDPESNFNYSDEFNMIKLDMLDEQVSTIPIHGLYDIDIEDVSTDIANSMMRYMLSAERQKKLIEINPQAQAIKSVLENPANAPKTKNINRMNAITTGVMTYFNKKGKYVRANAVDNFIQREFYGQTQAGWQSENRILNNTVNWIFKQASFGFFALNIPSALKNSLGAQFQTLIESASGKYYNPKDFIKAEATATKMMMDVSLEIYKTQPKSLDYQLFEVFDPVEGRFETKLKDSGLSRSIAKDALSFSWLYNFRKWVELHASAQVFHAMLLSEKVLQNGKEISYKDAWHVVDGKIQLKPGIDPEMGITYPNGEIKIGSKFINKRNQIQTIMRNLQGAYDNFNQPEAQRYILFRFVSFLRRYFTTMFVNRFGFKGSITNPKGRFNPGTGEITMGYYITALRNFTRMITSFGTSLQYTTNEELRAYGKVFAEIGGLLLMKLLIVSIFGWDDTDEDRYLELRKKTGPLPLPGVVDTDTPFNSIEFTKIHALNLIMNIKAENEQFIPLPGMGLDDYNSLIEIKSAVLGPTIDAYASITQDLWNIYGPGIEDKAYYKRKVGPYQWQQQEGSKLWSHIFRSVGVTGSTVDPITAIKNFESVQARAK